MASDRYKRLKSQYILRKLHQTVDGGKIYECDWPTVGERHNIGPDKKSVFPDSGFLFTQSTLEVPFTRSVPSRWDRTYTYDDVKDATGNSNRVELCNKNTNPSAFSYYSSFADLVEGTIIDIVLNFPGEIRYNNIPVGDNMSRFFNGKTLCELRNPFSIDMVSTISPANDDVNHLRYLTSSWSDYVVSRNGIDEPITSYTVTNLTDSVDMLKTVSVVNDELVVFNGRYYKYDRSSSEYYEVGVEESDNYFVKCGEYIRNKDSYYRWNDEKKVYNPIEVVNYCPPDIYLNYVITIETKTQLCNDDVRVNTYNIYGYKIYGNLIFYNELTEDEISIHPNKSLIDSYFNNLDDFSKYILDRNTNPLYTFSMNTINYDANGFMNVSVRKYTFPSYGYCIEIDTPEYMSFVSSFMDTAEKFDNAMGDNIWRNMTHESIKNFDHSYETGNSLSDDDEIDVGINRMQSILRLIGMGFDELKRYIDGIGTSMKVTYDGDGNMPDSELSTKCENDGVEISSTIWNDCNYVEIDESEIPEGTVVNNHFSLPDPYSVSGEYVSVGCEGGDNGIRYYHKECSSFNDSTISDDFLSQYITKGNPWIGTSHTGYLYVRTALEPDVPEGYWSTNNTFDTAPSIGTRFSPKYVRVYSGTSFIYFEKVHSTDNPGNIHSKWYPSLKNDSVTQESSYIDFTRRMCLSTRELMRSKGTFESIDMVMGMFGFGRDEDMSDTDYTLTETYYKTTPKAYDDTFYFYESVPSAEDGVTYSSSNTFATIPLNATDSLVRFPEHIRVSDGFGGYTYYRKNSSYTVREAVSKVYGDMRNSIQYFDKMYGGIPLFDTYINGERYLIPHYSDKYSYKGNFCFQSKGGWLKRSNTNSGIYDYTETVPYVRCLETCQQLLESDPLSFNVGDYVYVRHIADYQTVFGTIPEFVSNYFKLLSPDTSDSTSWENIPMDGGIIFDNYVAPYGKRATHTDYLNVKRIDNIVSTATGNNPHSGNGVYDSGNTYLEYMSLPFKYPIENYEFSDIHTIEMASQLTFAIDELFTPNNSVMFIDIYGYSQIDEPTDIDESYWNSLNTFNSVPQTISPSFPLIIRVSNGDGYIYFKKGKQPAQTDEYRLNSKVITMTNMLNNNFYRRYFRSIMLGYLTQVIPSTAILVLENFDDCADNNGVFHCVRVSSSDETMGTAEGGGEFAECDYAHIKAVAKEGYHFIGWEVTDCTYTIEDENEYVDSDKPEMSVKVLSDVCYTAHFKENCIVTLSNAVIDCDSIGEYDVVECGYYTDDEQNIYKPGTSLILPDNGNFGLMFNINEGYGDEVIECHIFDSNGNDVRKQLEIDGYVIFDGNNKLTIVNSEKLCGCRILYVCNRNYFEISVDTECEDCGEVAMSKPEQC